MRRILLDTGPAQHFLNGTCGVRERADHEHQRGTRIGICTPVLGELWSGVEGSVNREANLALLKRGLSQLVVWPFDEKTAEEFGRLYMLLKRAGRPMQQIDIQIAAIAFVLGNCTVATTDSDLTSVPGLTVEYWGQEVS